ncbi:hypothetical protein [Sphingomonas immobilis]|uniref:Uncharacterized protein n=1 Tax=Sphingomonas immobilis TaxID=3063997 RepID=A0ABT8ZV57_9SPHN|nr:hypothetical protein [Sphingomonas sp. CA1-15]MDO7841097.1 hypothetical protein [Sphingomonas sp. CA1-15]
MAIKGFKELAGSVPVDVIMERLDLMSLPDGCPYSAHQSIEFECVEVEQGVIDDNATEVEPETIDPDLNDLREGLEALRGGDVAMARILLERAFDAHDDEVRQAIAAALQPKGVRRAA